MEVQVEIAPSPGLKVAPIEPQRIPAVGRLQIRASAEVTRTGQFTVQASVRTPGGELLGPPSRLRMQSTVYGTITLWLTGSAGVLLVVLAARRVVRRVRGEEPQRREIVLGPRPGSAPASASPVTSGPSAVAVDGPTEALPARSRRTGDPFPASDSSTDSSTDSTVRSPAVRPGQEQPPTDHPPTGQGPIGATDRLPPARRPRPEPPEPPRVGSR
jgi:hypothetical protein